RAVAGGRAFLAQTSPSRPGRNAGGTWAGRSLSGGGAAAVHFQMSTGRMPGKALDAEMPRKPVTFTPEQIRQVAAYISALGGGPESPPPPHATTAGAPPARGHAPFLTTAAQTPNLARPRRPTAH